MSEQFLQQQLLESYDELSENIFRHCFFRVSDREVALDLMQETFMRTWKYVRKGKDIHDVKAFLYKTANNLIIDYYRKKKTTSLESLTEAEETPFQPSDNAHLHMLAQAELEQVLNMLEQVEEPYRQAVTLRHVDGLSPQEIAEIIGESPNNVSVRINRGIEKLQQLMTQHE